MRKNNIEQYKESLKNNTKPWMNAALKPSERAELLLTRMEIPEKIGQLVQIYAAAENTDEVCICAAAGAIGSRVLASNALAGNAEQSVASIREGNQAQYSAVFGSRLGIPLINGRDIIHGHRTVFPIPLAMAATWQPELLKQTAAVAASEAAAHGVHWTFSPMLDIARDPRWGRIIEGFGEDPFLCGKMAEASVCGYHEGIDGIGLAACAKHFIAYGTAEGGRDYNVGECSWNTLLNVYLRPFRMAVRAGADTVMSSFQEVGGEPVSGSQRLLTGLLKEKLGFDGFVVSDWASIQQLMHHGIAADEKEAARIAMLAGVDMDMADPCYRDHLSELLQTGDLSLERLDDAVRRILKVKFQIGLFENPFTNEEEASSKCLLPKSRILAREAASTSMVLLKNTDHLLPLPKTGKTVCLIGPFADVKRPLMGSWVMDGREEDVITLLEGIRMVAPDCSIITATLEDDMLSAARKADVVILALGESHQRNGEGANVTELQLSEGQLALIRQLKRFDTPIVSVVFSGRPLVMTEVAAQSHSLLWAWHPGIEGGAAAAELLFGDASPSGRLPVTFPRSVGQIPIYYNHKRNGHNIDEYYAISERIHYADNLGTPLYPFGYGLGYTTFALGEPEWHDKEQKASISVTNTGERQGTETVQWYLRDRVSSMTRPTRELIGFCRIVLEPGQSGRVSLQITPELCAFYDAQDRYIAEKGEFDLFVGNHALTEKYITFALSETVVFENAERK